MKIEPIPGLGSSSASRANDSAWSPAAVQQATGKVPPVAAAPEPNDIGSPLTLARKSRVTAKPRKRFQMIRKSKAQLDQDRDMAELFAELESKEAERVAPYPSYLVFQFSLQRRLTVADGNLLMAIHHEQRGADGCTLSDDELVAEYRGPRSYDVQRALKRLRCRGMIVATENGKGVRVHLPRVFRRVPEPPYWPDRRTWRPFVPVEEGVSCSTSSFSEKLGIHSNDE